MPRQIVEDVGDERALDDRGDRLRHARRDGPQPRALAADEDDGLGGSAVTRAHARSTAQAPASAEPGVAETDALVLQAGRRGDGGVDEVAPVDEQRALHDGGGGGPVEARELRPLGDQDGRVGALERLAGARR